jgi:hypothetical protein
LGSHSSAWKTPTSTAARSPKQGWALRKCIEPSTLNNRKATRRHRTGKSINRSPESPALAPYAQRPAASRACHSSTLPTREPSHRPLLSKDARAVSTRPVSQCELLQGPGERAVTFTLPKASLTRMGKTVRTRLVGSPDVFLVVENGLRLPSGLQLELLTAHSKHRLQLRAHCVRPSR